MAGRPRFGPRPHHPRYGFCQGSQPRAATGRYPSRRPFAVCVFLSLSCIFFLLILSRIDRSVCLLICCFPVLCFVGRHLRPRGRNVGDICADGGGVLFASLTPLGAPNDCAVLNCTVLYCTVLNCNVLNCTVLCAVLCCTALCCTVLCCVVLCCVVLCCAVLCCVVLYCAVL